jgi:hypothetical protein
VRRGGKRRRARHRHRRPRAHAGVLGLQRDSPGRLRAILWRDSNKKVEAAAALKITSSDLLSLGLIDAIVPEPAGGAHNDYDAATALVDQALAQALAELSALGVEELLAARYDKFRRMGREGQAFVDPALGRPRSGA